MSKAEGEAMMRVKIRMGIKMRLHVPMAIEIKLSRKITLKMKIMINAGRVMTTMETGLEIKNAGAPHDEEELTTHMRETTTVKVKMKDEQNEMITPRSATPATPCLPANLINAPKHTDSWLEAHDGDVSSLIREWDGPQHC